MSEVTMSIFQGGGGNTGPLLCVISFVVFSSPRFLTDESGAEQIYKLSKMDWLRYLHFLITSAFPQENYITSND